MLGVTEIVGVIVGVTMQHPHQPDPVVIQLGINSYMHVLLMTLYISAKHLHSLVQSLKPNEGYSTHMLSAIPSNPLQSIL